MPLQKTEAIVLKMQRQGETSKILTFYTRAFGKIKVIAKGARSSKSRFGGSLEPLNYISIVFYEKDNRDLHILSQADIIDSFLKIRQSLEKTVIAMAACELLDRIELGISPSPQMFKLLVEMLQAVSEAVEKPLNCFRAYQVRLFKIIGIAPNLSNCLQCQKPAFGDVIFDINHGGYICENCIRPTTPGMVLPHQSMAALRVFQKSPIVKLNGLLPSESDQQLMDDFLATYLKYHFEGMRELKSLAFLKKIK